jgi:transcriptional regulator with XRE-family HTH domain
MTVNPIVKIIRAKKLGVLIRDARLQSGKSLENCAHAIGIPEDELIAMEYGERPPTLPELELFAYYLEVPLDHFWGSETLNADKGENIGDSVEIIKLRQNAIGSLLHQSRDEAKLSIEELAGKIGISVDDLQKYEQGEVAIPLPELELVVQALNNSITDFEDQNGQAGTWFNQQKYLREFLNLPEDLQQFVSKPINRPYLELAIRMSELKVERLRALAEGLLEITL